jgi:Domain of unknown function (DUF1707)
VQGGLPKDELDARVGQAQAARTYADLATLIADLPAGLAAAEPPYQPARARAPRPVRTSPKVSRTRARASAPADSPPVQAADERSRRGPVPAALVGPLGSCRAVDRRDAQPLPPAHQATAAT